LSAQQTVYGISKEIEIFEISPCDGGVIWFNDWYEGQSFIKLIGIMNIETLFELGFYKDLYCEFMEDK
jgi:hypothetical protein